MERSWNSGKAILIAAIAIWCIPFVYLLLPYLADFPQSFGSDNCQTSFFSGYA